MMGRHLGVLPLQGFREVEIDVRVQNLLGGVS